MKSIMSLVVAILLSTFSSDSGADGGNIWMLSGWTADKNAAFVRSSSGDDGVGINFSMNGRDARIIVCSSERSLHGTELVRVIGAVDEEHATFVGSMVHVPTTNCWRAKLETAVLASIKKGHALGIIINDGSASYAVNLFGVAAAMDTAWAYVEAKLKQQKTSPAIVVSPSRESIYW